MTAITAKSILEKEQSTNYKEPSFMDRRKSIIDSEFI